MSQSTFITASFDATGSSFAAVYQALDHHRLRVVSTSRSTNKLPGREFVIDKSIKVQTLKWVTLPSSTTPQPLKKQRKSGEHTDDSAAAGSVSDVVVLGTSKGTVLFYSPASDSITTSLETGSSAAVCSIVVPNKSGPSSKLYCLQMDSTLTEFDLSKMSLVASTVISVENCSAAASMFPNLIVANTQPSLITDYEISMTFPGFATSIKQVLPLGPNHFAALAEEDRQVTVYETSSTKPVKYLIIPSTNAVHMSCNADQTALAITSEANVVYVFENPTKAVASSKENKAPRKGKSVNRATPTLTIDVVLEKKNTKLPVAQTQFIDNFLQLVWTEQGSIPVFDQVKYTNNDNSQVASGVIKIEKQPAGPQAKEHLVGGVDPASVRGYDENQTKVVSGNDVADLDDDNTLADKLYALDAELSKQDAKSGNSERSVSDVNSSVGGGAEEKATATPTKKSGEAESRLRKKDLKLKLSQPGSFAVLLNQALTLNDKQLLEICLEEKDPSMIKTSIVKLDPSLAASLLEHLASIMAHSHNRSGELSQWIRWVVVIHGSYLITLPNLLKTLAALHSTLSARAATLPRLLALQGRLELLEDQFTIRNEISAAIEEEDEDIPEAYYDEEEEEAMIVNGEEGVDDSDEDVSEGESDSGESDDDSDEELGDDGEVFDDDEIMLSE